MWQLRRDDDYGFLCGSCFDLLFYLSAPPTAAEGRAALEVYRAVCPAAALSVISSPNGEWDKLSSPLAASDLEPYLALMDERIDEGIWVWDEEEDGWSFLIRGVPPQPMPIPEEVEEIDEAEEQYEKASAASEEMYSEDQPDEDEVLQEVASFCQVQLPDTADPEQLVVLARGLAEVLPFVSGHGGYSFSYDPWRKDEAFDQIHAWAKRYRGIDIPDLNLTLPLVRSAAKTVNWLTLVGHDLWKLLARARGGAMPVFPAGITVEHGTHGVLIRAGNLPQIGDRNRQEFSQLYAAVDRMLKPILIDAHPEFPGAFSDFEDTDAWLRRFSEPDHW